MPNRILKESICTSESLAELSWFEQCLFIRLIVLADDYGRFDGRPAIIKGRGFPLYSVTDKQIDEALKHLETAGIVNLYKVGGRPYLQLESWSRHQNIRAQKSKYPPPGDDLHTSANNCMQRKSDVPVIQSESESISLSESPPVSPPAKRGGGRAHKAEPAVQWAENVTMTNEEHQKLLDAHGPADTARLIEILDNYKGSTGKWYTSDYRAILSWCVARLQEEKRKGGAKQTSNNPSARRSDPHNARKNVEWMRQVLAEEEKQGGGCDA